MLLSTLAKAAKQEVLETRGDCEIGSMALDSRKKLSKGLYFCIPGMRFDGHSFAPQAIQNGAVALVVTRYLDELDVPQVRVKNVRAAMSLMAADHGTELFPPVTPFFESAGGSAPDRFQSGQQLKDIIPAGGKSTPCFFMNAPKHIARRCLQFIPGCVIIF